MIHFIYICLYSVCVDVYICCGTVPPTTYSFDHFTILRRGPKIHNRIILFLWGPSENWSFSRWSLFGLPVLDEETRSHRTGQWRCAFFDMCSDRCVIVLPVILSEMRVMATANGWLQGHSDADKIKEPPRNFGFISCKIASISDNFVSLTWAISDGDIIGRTRGTESKGTQAIIKNTRSYLGGPGRNRSLL